MFEAWDKQTQKERGEAKADGISEQEAFDASPGN